MDLRAVPKELPGTILFVVEDGTWRVVQKRAFAQRRPGWSYVEDVSILDRLDDYEDDASHRLWKLTPGLAGWQTVEPAEVRNTACSSLGHEPEGTVVLSRSKIVGNDDVFDVAILVDNSRSDWRGSGCAFTDDDSPAALLQAFGGSRTIDESNDVAVFAIAA